MKRLSLVISLFSTILCHAQTSVPIDWLKLKTSPAGGRSEGWGVSVDPKDHSVYWPVSLDSQNQGLDIVCYKFDKMGKMLWNTPFFDGGANTQHAFCTNAKDTFLYIGGRFCTIATECDMYLLKVDKSSGKIIWRYKYPFASSGYDELDDIITRPEGIYCNGWAHGSTSGAYDSDGGLMLLDYNGRQIWSHKYGMPNTAEHLDGTMAADSEYMYCTGLWNGHGLLNLYDGRALLAKFDHKGNMVDSASLSYGSSSFTHAENGLGMTTDGKYLYLTGYSTPTANNWQIFVAKVDKNLKLVWKRYWGGTNTEEARAIKVYNGIVYVGGATASVPYSSKDGDFDAVLLKYDTAGNFISYQTYATPKDEEFRDIVMDDGALYLTGSSGAKLFSGGNSDVSFLIHTRAVAAGIENQFAVQEFEVFPNPAAGTLCINVPAGMTINVKDLPGRILCSYHEAMGLQQIDISTLKKGVYLLQGFDGKIFWQGRFVKE